MSGKYRYRCGAVGSLSCACACVLAGNAAAVEPTAPPVAEGAGAPAEHHASVFVDPLGFLLFGPTLGVEVGIGRMSGTVYGRFFSIGLLSQSMFLNGPRHDSFDFSYGVGLRGRYYFFGGLSGPHVGAGVEYLSTRIEDPVDLIATNAQYLVPQVEGGYRLGIGNFFVGVAAALGYAVQLSSSVDNLPGGNSASHFMVLDQSKFYGSASLDFGLYF
jgi:hypothetical protein